MLNDGNLMDSKNSKTIRMIKDFASKIILGHFPSDIGYTPDPTFGSVFVTKILGEDAMFASV